MQQLSPTNIQKQTSIFTKKGDRWVQSTARLEYYQQKDMLWTMSCITVFVKSNQVHSWWKGSSALLLYHWGPTKLTMSTKPAFMQRQIGDTVPASPLLKLQSLHQIHSPYCWQLVTLWTLQRLMTQCQTLVNSSAEVACASSLVPGNNKSLFFRVVA